MGTYPITVTGNGGGIQQNTTVTLTVTAAANFTISASPASLSVAQGNPGNLDDHHHHQRRLQQLHQPVGFGCASRHHRELQSATRFRPRAPATRP